LGPRAPRPEWNRRRPSLREGTLTAHEDAGEGVRRVVFSVPRWDGDDPVPGQFLMVKVSGTDDPLLLRPFGFSSFVRRGLGGDAEAWYRVAGRGTALMSRWAVGDRISFIGPLGRGFPLPPAGDRPLLVAGGVGIPPLLFLARSLQGSAGGGEGRPLVLYGGRTRRQLFGLDALEAAGAEVATCTEDGSHGRRGLVTALLTGLDLSGFRVYACGPNPMLAAVWRLAAGPAEGPGKARCRGAHLSLEARMACGFGVCAGCAVRVAPPGGEEGPSYLRVCRDGPVFDAGQLVEESFTA